MHNITWPSERNDLITSFRLIIIQDKGKKLTMLFWQFVKIVSEKVSWFPTVTKQEMLAVHEVAAPSSI